MLYYFVFYMQHTQRYFGSCSSNCSLNKGYLSSIPAYKKSQLCTTCLHRMMSLLWSLAPRESAPSWKRKTLHLFHEPLPSWLKNLYPKLHNFPCTQEIIGSGVENETTTPDSKDIPLFLMLCIKITLWYTQHFQDMKLLGTFHSDQINTVLAIFKMQQ